MIADDDEGAAGPCEAAHLAVHWSEVGEVLVRQRLRAELVRRGRQAGVRHVGRPQRPVDARALRARQHLRRDVDAVDGGLGTPAPQPEADAPGAAGEVEHRAHARPVDGPHALEQPQVHLVVDGRLVRA